MRKEDDANDHSCEICELATELADERTAHQSLRDTLGLLRDTMPDPMHPSVPPAVSDWMVNAGILLGDALGEEDPGDAKEARAALSAVRKKIEEMSMFKRRKR